MESSILISTKKVLGIASDYTAFDLDILTHINSAFSVLNQLGIGADAGFMIEDDTAVWGDFDVTTVMLNLIRTYIFLKVRLVFDPPQTSFLLDAMQKQIQELEWRLNTLREAEAWTTPV